MSTPAIEAEGLIKRYGAVRAVDGVSLSVVPGEVFALLGPNGAGKTTTVEILEGYRRADAGSVRVLGLDPRRERRKLLPRIGLMLQEGGLAPGVRAIEALRLYCAFYDDGADAGELLDLVGLRDAARTTYRRLSGGQKQRLSFALALAGRPEVLFLDEPTSGMDPHGRTATEAAIRRLGEAGVAVLLTTHDMGEAERLADRVAIIDRGRVVASGRPADLVRSTADEVRFSAAPGLDVGALSEAIGAPALEERHGEYLVRAPGEPAMVAAITAWLAERGERLGDLRAGRERLEDVFLRLTMRGEPGDGRERR